MVARQPVPSAQHELDAPPWRRVESTLMATSRAIRRAYDRRLSDTGVNLSEASILVFVHEQGPLTQSRIAERIGLGRAAAGAMIDGLCRRDLLQRRPDLGDRRVWLVVTTAKTPAVVEQIEAIDKRLRDELRAGIGREDRQQLAKTLVRLHANLQAILENG